jgi:hypothetical protein
VFRAWQEAAAARRQERAVAARAALARHEEAETGSNEIPELMPWWKKGITIELVQ